MVQYQYLGTAENFLPIVIGTAHTSSIKPYHVSRSRTIRSGIVNGTWDVLINVDRASSAPLANEVTRGTWRANRTLVLAGPITYGSPPSTST